jgi:hypothetical protein
MALSNSNRWGGKMTKPMMDEQMKYWEKIRWRVAESSPQYGEAVQEMLDEIRRLREANERQKALLKVDVKSMLNLEAENAKLRKVVEQFDDLIEVLCKATG